MDHLDFLHLRPGAGGRDRSGGEDARQKNRFHPHDLLLPETAKGLLPLPTV